MVGLIRRSRLGLAGLVLTTVATGCGGETSAHSGGSGNSGGSSMAAGGGGGAAPSCGTARITLDEAATLYTSGVFDVKPDSPLPARAELEELEVVGLRESLEAQLFDVMRSSGDSSERADTVLYYQCRLFMLGSVDNRSTGPIASALIAKGAFYFSWEWGSGDVRSQVGKLTPAGSGLTRVQSVEYFNRLLVLEASGSDILAYPGVGLGFNQLPSSGAAPVGKLEEAGDRLMIVDGSGKEIPTKPPF